MDLSLTQATASGSDGARIRLEHAGEPAEGVRLHYSFAAPGFMILTVPCPLDLPENYHIEFELHGEGVFDRLECKLVDADGARVWWVLSPHSELTGKWEKKRFKKRHFVFAWGPTEEPLRSIRQIEIAAVAGGAAVGTLAIRGLILEELPATGSALHGASVHVSSGEATSALLNPLHPFAWRSDDRVEQTVEILFPEPAELGGVILHWGEGYPVRYDLQLLEAERGWGPPEKVTRFRGEAAYHSLPEAEVAGLRVVLHERGGNVPFYELRSVECRGVEFSSSRNSFLMHYAARKPKGYFPRYLQREQSYWTVVGGNGSSQKGLMNEEGLVELGYGLPSLDGFLRLDGTLYGWDQGAVTQHLSEGYLPIPVVERTVDGLALSITAWLEKSGGNEVLYCTYTVRNRSAIERSGELYVALRPYRVNPPWQSLNTSGGFFPVEHLELGEERGFEVVRINGTQPLISLQRSQRFGAYGFWSGDVVEVIADGEFGSESQCRDSSGYCSGAFEFSFTVAPGNESSYSFACPFDGAIYADSAAESFERTASYWRELLQPVQFSIASVPELDDTVRSQLAYILVNRSGAAIQPGTRSYRRTWIRDGALTSSALLYFGLYGEVRDFIAWYAPYVLPDGWVPCVVDHRGPDLTPEHDSHGEFLYLVAEYYRYSRDAAFVKPLVPLLLRVARCIDRLSSESLGAGAPSHTRGLLPKSISHEGYCANPAYSLWDNLWAVRGLEGLAAVVNDLGSADEAAECLELRNRFAQYVVVATEQAMAHHHIDFLPGAADLGDFDATSTTIGADPCTLFLDHFHGSLVATFERYWQFFQDRLPSFSGRERYTPYEWRAVGTYLRLGQRERAHELIDFFMAHRRPPGWRHWAEVVWANEREPQFIGDAPHGWVASDFLRAVRGLALYQHGDSWVIGAGLTFEWWADGVMCRSVTPDGAVNISSSALPDGTVEIRLDGPAVLPCVFKMPDGTAAAGLPSAREGNISVQLPVTLILQRT